MPDASRGYSNAATSRAQRYGAGLRLAEPPVEPERTPEEHVANVREFVTLALRPELTADDLAQGRWAL